MDFLWFLVIQLAVWPLICTAAKAKVKRSEQKLAEVKQLYQQKHGQEVDEEDMSVHYDADGTPWIQTSGTGVATDLREEEAEKARAIAEALELENWGM